MSYVDRAETFHPGSPSFKLPPDDRSDIEKLKDALDAHLSVATEFRKLADRGLMKEGDEHKFRILEDRYFCTKEELNWHVENVTCVSASRLLKALSI
jgi:hypothetical protein